MRKVKFRAWDKDKKTWTRWKWYDSTFYFMDRDSGEWCEDDEFLRFILVQYTDWQDKDGKEIYEGDIYLEKQYVRRKPEKIYWSVVWDDLDCGFSLVANKKMNTRGKRYIKKMQLPLKAIPRRKMEYAGTIYENPELLET